MSIGCFLTADVAFCREQKTKGKHPHTHNNTMSAYAGLSSLVGTTLFFYGFLHTGKLRYAEVETIKVEKRKLAHAHVVDAVSFLSFFSLSFFLPPLPLSSYLFSFPFSFPTSDSISPLTFNPPIYPSFFNS